MQLINFNKRPLSWSAISSFEFSKEQWYSKYILNEPAPDNLAMEFGRKFAKSVEDRKPLVPVTIYKEVEYPLKVVFGGIPMVGFIDTYEPHTALREYKTARQLWTQKKANEHGQLAMYALMLYITHKVKPENLTIHLDCIQTVESGDFVVDFLDKSIHSFEVKLTMKDILNFGTRIMRVVKEMESYTQSRA